MWTTLEVIIGGFALLLAFIGNKYSMPALLDAGVAGLGLTSIAIGLEAIITRRIVLGWRRHSGTQLYTGIRAVFQGLQFSLFGLFLIAAEFLMYLHNGREVILQMARRPGLPLMVFGGLCLLQAIITFVGPPPSTDGSRWVEIAYLLFVRLLPALILVVIGIALVGLGLFETVAPAAFDQMGGSFLEALYGLR